ncbi:VOC family protein [Peteryoungia ipomoeae]|uniref:VOC family protein n=1 Tax=Peteryoungia ipomoeae TaxID=1210932 RepID=A0A4S8P5S0_9HYPH|nr:VOC family protein [Peteryoungia ipomoeae]THV23089.1 VOC family protein [Peteryoungia ipomoeae]
MTIGWTRRKLLKLTSLATMGAAMARAAEAEGIEIQTVLTTPSEVLPTALARPVHVGEVALRARDIGLLKRYYMAMLKLSVITETADRVTLGAGGTPLLTLLSRPDAKPEEPGQAGLYHTAFLMPTRADLAKWLVHIAIAKVPLTGFADHSVSEAVYLSDPEGNGVEVYCDRPEASWLWAGGQVSMGTKELDIEDILAKTETPTDRSLYTAVPDALCIGHIHLRVGTLDKARDFYAAGLGLDVVRGDDARGATFLSSGRYHHHVGANIWESRDAGQRQEGMTGLDWFSLKTKEDALIASRRADLETRGYSISPIESGFEAKDPWGTRVRLVKT